MSKHNSHFEPKKLEKDDIKILCPFCNSEQTAEMELDYASIDTSGKTTVCIGIYCHNCGKTVYIKEMRYHT